MSGRWACDHPQVIEEPDAVDDVASRSDAVPEPEGFLLAAPTPGFWDVLPTPPKPWPALSRRGENSTLPASTPSQAIPTSWSGAGSRGMRIVGMSRSLPEMVARLFATIVYEVRGGTGPESQRLYSGGGMLAVAILAAVVTLIVFIGSAAVGSTPGMVVAGFLCALAVALGVVGSRRFRRKDMG